MLEVRKENGNLYPPNSLYSLCCGLQRTIRVNGQNIFTDALFAKFREVLDSQMKKLKSTGSFERKCADVITERMEDILWNLKLLGDDNPQSLLDTTFFYIGLYFALRGGEEHRRLHHSPSQIQIYEPPNAPSYVTYTEDISKTNQGGLKHRNRNPKKVTHYENKECPERCLVRILKRYNSRCPLDRPPNALYLKPLKRPVGDVWYSKSAIVHNILGKTIQCLMKAANIPGTFSNHSLRSTVTTRLFNARVDEQLIMSRTGHSSTAGVRAYKRTSEQLLEHTSDVLNKKTKLESSAVHCTSSGVLGDVTNMQQSSLGLSGLALNMTGCTVNFNINNYSK